MPFRDITAADLFECQQCGDCCKGYGGTYVTPADIKRISGFIGASSETFIDKYCRISGGRPLLSQQENGYCVFFDKNCAIHPVKPRMCKAWPFISSIITDPQNWELMSSVCPGIRTNYPTRVIIECVRKQLAAQEKEATIPS